MYDPGSDWIILYVCVYCLIRWVFVNLVLFIIVVIAAATEKELLS